MEKFILKSLLILGFLATAACSSGGEVEDISGLDSYSVVSGSFSQADSTALHIAGTTGVVRFTSTLPGVSSSRSISLKASLNNVTLSDVSAVFYASDSSVSGSTGIVVTFSRTGASVNASITFNGQTCTVTSSDMGFYIPNNIDVVIDVHNVGTKSRVYIWRRDNLVYAPTSADVDSNSDVSSALPTAVGPGTFAGLILNYATVTAAQVSTPKVLD